jgi:muramidase (phage lysozyme)
MTSTKITPARLKPLLDLIGQAEARGDYNVIWGGIRKQDYPKMRLTDMTIGQVLDWQDSIDYKYMSEASGRYQFMEDTLREIYSPAGLNLDSEFNAANQDHLAIYLLKRRGLNRYLRNEITTAHFANNIAREWASFPVVDGPKRGASYYSGDGLNKAGVKPEQIMQVLRALRENSGPVIPPTQPTPKPAPIRKPGFFELILSFLSKVFGK